MRHKFRACRGRPGTAAQLGIDTADGMRVGCRLCTPAKEPVTSRGERRMTGFISRRSVLALGASLGALGLTRSPALAQQRFFRIGTGGTGGTYYPVGGMIANAVSTDKINVSAVATNGSVANVN